MVVGRKLKYAVTSGKATLVFAKKLLAYKVAGVAALLVGTTAMAVIAAGLLLAQMTDCELYDLEDRPGSRRNAQG